MAPLPLPDALTLPGGSMSLTFPQYLTGTERTLEAFVLVGGTLLGKHHRHLVECARRGVQVRFLFPNLRSRWLEDYIVSAGLSLQDSRHRIRSNAATARELGSNAEVRFHHSPVPSWFVLCDRAVVVRKPVA